MHLFLHLILFKILVVRLVVVVADTDSCLHVEVDEVNLVDELADLLALSFNLTLDTRLPDLCLFPRILEMVRVEVSEACLLCDLAHGVLGVGERLGLPGEFRLVPVALRAICLLQEGQTVVLNVDCRSHGAR